MSRSWQKMMVKRIMLVIKRGIPDLRDIAGLETLGFSNRMTISFLSRVTRMTMVKLLPGLGSSYK